MRRAGRARLTLLWLAARCSAASVAEVLRRRLDAAAVAHRIAVDGDGGARLGFLELHADDEVADAAYAFGFRHGLDAVSRQALVKAVCEGNYDTDKATLKPGAGKPRCTRTAAVLYENVVKSPVDGQPIPGRLRVWEAQQPEDAVAAFLFRYAPDVPDWFGAGLLDRLCADSVLSKLWLCESAPKVVVKGLEVTIDDASSLGTLEVFSGEEVIDAVSRFALAHPMNADMSSQLFRSLCKTAAKTFKCTRSSALLFSAAPVLHRGADGAFAEASAPSGAPESLEVFAGDEPADVAYTFATAHGWPITAARRLARELCGHEAAAEMLPRRPAALACARVGPVVDRLPIRGPYGKDKEEVLVGTLDVVDGAEAHDLAYAFSVKHGCHGCDFYVRLAASLCTKPNVLCTRRRAIAWATAVAKETVQGLGWPRPKDLRIEVWEGEQVVDGVRSLWYSSGQDGGSDDGEVAAPPRALRRALSALACAQLAPRELCARAEEIVAAAHVEQPKAAKMFNMSWTRPRVDDAACGRTLRISGEADDGTLAEALAAAAAAAAAGGEAFSSQFDGCAPTLYDFGVVGWSGVLDLQVLGVRNDSEADRRGIHRGMRLRSIDGAGLDRRPDAAAALALKAMEPTPTALEFLIVDEHQRFLGSAPVQVFEDQWASDAVYEACKKHELLQPNYTHAGWPQKYYDALCAPEAQRPPGNEPPEDCRAAGKKYTPRMLLFELPLDFGGLKHTLRYYADEWRPCAAGEYDGASLEHGGSTWPHGADDETSAAIAALDAAPAAAGAAGAAGGCVRGPERAARAWCTRLGPPQPSNCLRDVLGLVDAEVAKSATKRWNEKATPDGFDLYAVLGVPRDADNATVVAAHARIDADVRAPAVHLLSRLAAATADMATVASARAAARLLLANANATRDRAAAAVDDERRRIDRARLASFGVVSNATTLALREGLADVFGGAAEVDLDDALQRLAAAGHGGAVLDKLLAAGLVDTQGGAAPKRRRNAPQPKTVFLTPSGDDPRRQNGLSKDGGNAVALPTLLGADALAIQAELRGATANESGDLDWQRLAKRVGEQRATSDARASAIVYAVRQMIESAERRTQTAAEILRLADDVARSANATLQAIDKPLKEISKRAHALHQALDTLADETNRDFYDRPCRPVFGACCVRDSPDGGMRITCG
ncbi:hypothetical protein M885DRAFT_614323 [Pelagophyceae sp. CCMP2097]|nr:hypothetical protein M885DRAFT_614323 [Pelagophyceae sp. CCMP2097]